MKILSRNNDSKSKNIRPSTISHSKYEQKKRQNDRSSALDDRKPSHDEPFNTDHYVDSEDEDAVVYENRPPSNFRLHADDPNSFVSRRDSNGDKENLPDENGTG